MGGQSSGEEYRANGDKAGRDKNNHWEAHNLNGAKGLPE